MSQTAEVSISCHCGAAKQTVILRPPESQATPYPLDVSLCHCHAYRHTSGLLCVSYVPIYTPPSLSGLRIYFDEQLRASLRASLSRYFCSTCGCHVFQLAQRSHNDSEESDELWAVATGIIIGRAVARNAEEGVDAEDEGQKPLLRIARHIGTASTRDGGLSPFIDVEYAEEPSELGKHGHEGASLPHHTASTVEDEVESRDHHNKEDDKNVLQARCHCKSVRFHITRPDASSRLPHSGFPDLMIPFKTSPREVITNPQNEKWWLCPQRDPNPTKYLAGTCACRSCRLTSGFEIQTWAFVPRSNIFFLPPSTSSTSTPPSLTPSGSIPLDFTTLPPGILQSYESSPGVLREFCPRCGATVFWHDRWRPDLVDVSVGLLDAPEGARAEKWLDWWCGRVSFEEDAVSERVGEVAGWARNLVGSLAKGLMRWENEEGKKS
ncbi:hypothetical protein F5Y06DRAFT_269683 [Hypoxylon sp. FL0890]|nr:hypothetical protein F5Y06DRAFT_269683 [Hypoxylon sp. FL0890]